LPFKKEERRREKGKGKNNGKRGIERQRIMPVR
jgi:hypothetical protein